MRRGRGPGRIIIKISMCKPAWRAGVCPGRWICPSQAHSRPIGPHWQGQVVHLAYIGLFQGLRSAFLALFRAIERVQGGAGNPLGHNGFQCPHIGPRIAPALTHQSPHRAGVYGVRRMGGHRGVRKPRHWRC